MVFAITLTNGLVFGFEWSTKHQLAQIHIAFISLVFMWGLKEEDFEDEGE